MGQITVDQSHTVMATLATNTNWKDIDFEGCGLQDAIIRDPKGVGERFTNFLKNGCRFIFGEMRKLALDKDFNFATFPGLEGYDYWKGPLDGDGITGKETWIDPRSESLTEFDPMAMIFKTCLREQDKSIKGFEKFRRLVEEEPDFIRYDLRVFHALWKDWLEKQENSVLEMFYRTRKVEYLDFMVPLRRPNGLCFVLYFIRHSHGEWHWDYDWLGRAWDASFSPSAPQVALRPQNLRARAL